MQRNLHKPQTNWTKTTGPAGSWAEVAPREARLRFLHWSSLTPPLKSYKNNALVTNFESSRRNGPRENFAAYCIHIVLLNRRCDGLKCGGIGVARRQGNAMQQHIHGPLQIPNPRKIPPNSSHRYCFSSYF